MFLNSQALGGSWDTLGRSRDALGALLGTPGALLGQSCALLGRSWGSLGTLLELLGASWALHGRLLDATCKNYKKNHFFEAQLGAPNPTKLAQKSFKNRCKQKHWFCSDFLLFLHLSRTSRKSSNLEFCRSCRCFTRFFKGWRLTLTS